MRTPRCRLELERKVLPANAAEDVDLPIVPLVQCTSEAFGSWLLRCGSLLLQRHGRHGRRHNVRDCSDVVSCQDPGQS